jgi:hypothetical protein
MTMTNTLRRRALIAGGAAMATALMPLRESVAQTAAARGDWLAMIKAHHVLIARSFEQLLGNDRRTYLQRDRLVRLIGYQLTAHSVAEENVIYPALARAGMVTESDKLYLDQAHAKVMNAQMELATLARRESDEWRAPAQALQQAVLRHAQGDEEGNYYPKLHQQLDAATNALLTAGYQREFSSVKVLRGA